MAWQWSPLYLTDSAVLINSPLSGVAACLAALAVVMTILSARKNAGVWCPYYGRRKGRVAKHLVGRHLAGESQPIDLGDRRDCVVCSDRFTWTLAQWPVCRSLATRLIQIHACLLLGSGGLQMLASEEWWDGTGSVAVAAPIGRRFLNLADWIGEPWIHESLTHLPSFAGNRGAGADLDAAFRSAAMWAVIGWCGVMALLSSQWIYFPTLAAMFLAFRSNQAVPQMTNLLSTAGWAMAFNSFDSRAAWC